MEGQEGGAKRLSIFDKVKRPIDARHDLRGSDLASLIVAIYERGGALSLHTRRVYAPRVPSHVLDAIERAVNLATHGKSLSDEPMK